MDREDENHLDWMEATKGVLFRFPGIMKVESWMSHSILSCTSPKPDMASLWRRVRPEVTIGPVKLITGGTIGRFFVGAKDSDKIL